MLNLGLAASFHYIIRCSVPATVLYGYKLVLG